MGVGDMAQWVEYLLAFMQPWLVSFPAPHEPSVAGCMISVLRLELGNWRTRGVQHYCPPVPKVHSQPGLCETEYSKTGSSGTVLQLSLHRRQSRHDWEAGASGFQANHSYTVRSCLRRNKKKKERREEKTRVNEDYD